MICGRQPIVAVADGLTIVEAIARDPRRALRHYVKNGKPTDEQAGIWAGRTEFEKGLHSVVVQICATTGKDFPKMRQKHQMMYFLADHGYIAKQMSNRKERIYSLASGAVHGDPLSTFEVTVLVADLTSMIDAVASIEPAPNDTDCEMAAS